MTTIIISQSVYAPNAANARLFLARFTVKNAHPPVVAIRKVTGNQQGGPGKPSMNAAGKTIFAVFVASLQVGQYIVQTALRFAR